MLNESGGKDSIGPKLRGLRDITKLTGTIDELQVTNLVAWGRIVFHPAKFGLSWDGIGRSAEYDVAVKGGKPPPARSYAEHQAYLKGLDTSVKELLGAEWLLTVKEDGREVFVGPRLVPFTPPKSLDQVPERGRLEGDARDVE